MEIIESEERRLAPRHTEEQARRQRDSFENYAERAAEQAYEQMRRVQAEQQARLRDLRYTEVRRTTDMKPVILFLNLDPKFREIAFTSHTTLPDIINRECRGMFNIKNVNFGYDKDIIKILEAERDDSIAHLVITTHGSVTSLVTGNRRTSGNESISDNINISTPRFNQFSDILRRKLTRTASILFTACLLGNVAGREEPDITPLEKIKFTNCDYENFASKLSMQLPNIEIFCTPHEQVANEINLEKINCVPLKLRYSSNRQSMYFYVFNGDRSISCDISKYVTQDIQVGEAAAAAAAAPAPEHPLDRARCYNILEDKETSLREYLDQMRSYPNKTNNIYIFTNGMFYCINIDEFNKKIFVPCIRNPPRDWEGSSWYYFNRIEYFGENPTEFMKIDFGPAGARYILIPPDWPRLKTSQVTPDNFTDELPTRFYNLVKTDIKVNKFAEKAFLDPDINVRSRIDVMGSEHCNQRGEYQIEALERIMDVNAFLDTLPQ